MQNPSCLTPLTGEVVFSQVYQSLFYPLLQWDRGLLKLQPWLCCSSWSPQSPHSCQEHTQVPDLSHLYSASKRLTPPPVPPSGCAVLSTPLLSANPGVLFFPASIPPPRAPHPPQHSTQGLAGVSIVSILKHQQFKATSFPRWAPKALRVHQTKRL